MASRSVRSSTKRKSETSLQQSSSSNSNASRKRSKQDLQEKAKPTSSSKAKTAETSQPDEPLRIEEETGDIFAAPPNALIIHACNCQGSWGAGIAKAFKDRYAHAYQEYFKHCEEHGNRLLDSAQLISPSDGTKHNNADNDEGFDEGKDHGNRDPNHFVGCLYTSRFYGAKKDSPSRILAATKPAMEDLLRQVKTWNEKAAKDDRVGEVRICKINSGMFNVPWERSKEVLQSIDVRHSDVKLVKVVSPPS